MTRSKQLSFSHSALSLPQISRTRSGIEFHPGDPSWSFRDGIVNVTINFSLLPKACAPLFPGLKNTLIWYLENRSPKTASGLFHDFIWLMRLVAGSEKNVIDDIHPHHIATVIMLSDKAEHRLSRLRGFLCKWHELGVLGVSKYLIDTLECLAPKQNPVGVAVATLDPKKGPLTDLEFEAIQIALNDAYSKNKITLEQLLLCYLFMGLGARPVQLASLKCSDLIIPKSSDGDYVLKVPCAKQKDTLIRGDFKLRKLSQQLGEPLACHMRKIQSEFAGHLKNVNDLPLFPQRIKSDYADSPGFQYHTTSYAISSRVIHIFTKLRVPSERLAEPIPMCAIRFRRTFATRAAEEGWPLLVLAEMMDHVNTKNVMIYAGLTSRVRANFSRKIAMDMAPLAKAFSGKIIRNEGEASRPIPASRIVDLRVDSSGAPMGSCGSYAHCNFARPTACYAGCMDFEPWLDGPHEATLDYLLARREALLTTTDPRIATINDRAILGCAQIILRCREILSENDRD